MNLLEPRGDGVRELHAAMCAREELDAELDLELAHLLAHRRLGDVQPLGGAPEVQLLGHRHEVAQLAQIHRSIIARRA